MIVCICNAIREKDVRAAAGAGISTARMAFARLGKKPKCASCHRYAESILAEEQARA